MFGSNQETWLLFLIFLLPHTLLFTGCAYILFSIYETWIFFLATVTPFLIWGLAFVCGLLDLWKVKR